MKYRVPLFAFVLTLQATIAVSAVSNCAEPSKTNAKADCILIPLKTVWAFRMDHTIDISSVTPPSHAPLIEQIHRSFSKIPDKRSTSPPSFVVAGEPTKSLTAMKEVFVDGKPASTNFRTTDELSVVFFSRLSPIGVQLKSIERCEHDISITYSFIPREESYWTEHFALIPLGRLPAGEYQIRVSQSPMDAMLLRKEFIPPADEVARATVCQPSKFEVAN